MLSEASRAASRFKRPVTVRLVREELDFRAWVNSGVSARRSRTRFWRQSNFWHSLWSRLTLFFIAAAEKSTLRQSELEPSDIRLLIALLLIRAWLFSSWLLCSRGCSWLLSVELEAELALWSFSTTVLSDILRFISFENLRDRGRSSSDEDSSLWFCLGDWFGDFFLALLTSRFFRCLSVVACCCLLGVVACCCTGGEFDLDSNCSFDTCFAFSIRLANFEFLGLLSSSSSSSPLLNRSSLNWSHNCNCSRESGIIYVQAGEQWKWVSAVSAQHCVGAFFLLKPKTKKRIMCVKWLEQTPTPYTTNSLYLSTLIEQRERDGVLKGVTHNLVSLSFYSHCGTLHLAPWLSLHFSLCVRVCSVWWRSGQRRIRVN